MWEHVISEREVARIDYWAEYDPWYIYLQLQEVRWHGDPSELDGAQFLGCLVIQLLAIHVHELAARYVEPYILETCSVPYMVLRSLRAHK